MQQSCIASLWPTLMFLELVDISKIKPKGGLDDEIVSLDSWEYLVYFFVILPRSTYEGHPMILGRPWSATVDAFIDYRYGNTFISWGDLVKKINLYPPTMSVTKLQDVLWYDDEYIDKEIAQLVFSIDQVT